jgi:hypothetical protein
MHRTRQGDVDAPPRITKCGKFRLNAASSGWSDCSELMKD